MKHQYFHTLVATVFVGCSLFGTLHAAESDTILSDFSAAIQTTMSVVSNDDINLYRHIRASTSDQTLRNIAAFTQKMSDRTKSMNQSQKNAYYDVWIKKIDNTILALTGKYFKDVTLPRDVNAKYQVLKLLRLEIDINLKHQMNVR